MEWKALNKRDIISYGLRDQVIFFDIRLESTNLWRFI